MKIHVDSHFVIGSSHITNQDYAMAGKDPVPFMVVADGCSSSPDSDIGARLVALAAREYLLSVLGMNECPNASAMARYVAVRAESSVRTLGIPNAALDATVVAAFITGEELEVILLGDGAVITASLSGAMEICSVEYSHNAPYYPSYRASPENDRAYRAISEERQAVKTLSRLKLTPQRSPMFPGMTSVQREEELTSSPVTDPTTLRFPLNELRLLAITTDGLTSFRSTADRQPVAPEVVAQELLTIRSPEGDFVKRRLKRALHTLQGKGIVHTDDFSMAAMLFEEEGEPWTSMTPVVTESV